MSFLFDEELTTAVDRLRRGLGDTIAPGLRSDEEYEATLIRYPDEALALAVMAEGLAVEYAQKPDSISDAGTTITWRERVKTWLALAGSARILVVATATAAGSAVTSLQATREDEYWPGEHARVRAHTPTWWTD